MTAMHCDMLIAPPGCRAPRTLAPLLADLSTPAPDVFAERPWRPRFQSAVASRIPDVVKSS
ncbi:hypothetical protein PUN4_560038 [Paraburkholderia unamae]|nr:hypothetical protein PUN4_560038 [Paraburkholderia unamae]